jgi:cutinase
MKFLPIVALLATLSRALPLDAAANDASLGTRALFSSDELLDGDTGSCPSVIFVYARGSLEFGNLVRLPMRLPITHVLNHTDIT